MSYPCQLSASHFEGGSTIVFIDPTIDHYQQLAEGIAPGIEVKVLDPAQDGVEQITSVLATRVGLKAVHIFSHGSPGHLYLGNTHLNGDTVEQFVDLSGWSPAMAAIDLFLYGCNVAAGANGSRFLQKLHELTGANIAASSSRTGNQALGGNWDLEVRLGQITPQPVLDTQVMERYEGVLATLTVTSAADSGAGSLREAVANAASGDTIVFAPGITTITLGSAIQVPISKSLTIDGGSAVTISGNNTTGILRGGDFSDLTVRNIALVNGRTTQRGAAIYADFRVNLTVENVTFSDNVADQGAGAIYLGFESTLLVNGSQFNNNLGIAANDERGAGAIATVTPGAVTILNSSFVGNRGINGAAINAINALLTVENSQFINNDTLAAQVLSTAGNGPLRGYGGAIYTDRANNSITIRNSTFEGNQSRSSGGAVHLFADPEDTVLIEGSLFRNNSSVGIVNGWDNGNAGAIGHIRNSSGSGTLTISNSSIINNFANAQGGGLWVFNTPTSVVNSTFAGNTAPNNFGGAITTYSPINLSNTTIVDNSALFSGGLATGSDNLATVSNTIFANNTSANTGVSFNGNQQTNRPFNDAGGNFQFPSGPALSGSITITDPQLGPVQQVGNTVYYPVLPGSPAINAGASLVNPQPGQVNLVIGNASLTEGNSGLSAMIFTVSLTGSSSQTVTVNYATANNTAIAGSDYTAVSGSLSFAPGQTTQTIEVPIIGDTLVEANETFFVSLSAPTNATLLTTQGVGTITNDDAPPVLPSLSINNVSLAESSGGTVAVFTVSLTGSSSQTVTVNYATANNTAIAGSDYTAVSGSLSFAPGQTTQTIEVPIIGDTLVEANETFFVSLSAPTNATITTAQGTGSITNDDFVNGNGSRATSDFDGDGKADILWRNADSGTNTLWFMDGGQIKGGATLLQVVGRDWQIQGSGDFDRDGKADILWRNSGSGSNTLWLMDGATIKAGVSLTEVASTTWQIQGTGDFDGDGNLDILWRNLASGENLAWLMEGAVARGSLQFSSLASNTWKVQATADFNGDGRADILWRNFTSGENVLWFTGFSTGSTLPQVSDLNWQIQGADDFDGNGTADILWRNYGGAQNGANGIWFLNSITPGAAPETLNPQPTPLITVAGETWRALV